MMLNHIIRDMRMSKISKVVAVISLLLNSMISMSQEIPEKYVVYIFEDTRVYSESGKTTRQSETYYWISNVDSLLEKGHLYPLYLSSVKDGSIIAQNGNVYLSPLANVNGMTSESKITLISPDSFSYPLVKWLDENKIEKQTISIKHTMPAKLPLRRMKEKIKIYYVPVSGPFGVGELQIDRQNSIQAYYALDMDKIGLAALEDVDIQKISYYDCSLVDFSSFMEAYSFFQKGHSLLRSTPISKE